MEIEDRTGIIPKNLALREVMTQWMAKLVDVCNENTLHQYLHLMQQLKTKTADVAIRVIRNNPFVTTHYTVNALEFFVLHYAGRAHKAQSFADDKVLQLLNTLVTDDSNFSLQLLMNLSMGGYSCYNGYDDNTKVEVIPIPNSSQTADKDVNLTDLAASFPALINFLKEHGHIATLQETDSNRLAPFLLAVQSQSSGSRGRLSGLITLCNCLKNSTQPDVLLDYFSKTYNRADFVYADFSYINSLLQQNYSTVHSEMLFEFPDYYDDIQKIHRDPRYKERVRNETCGAKEIRAICSDDKEMIFITREQFRAIGLKLCATKGLKAVWLRYIAYQTNYPLIEALKKWDEVANRDPFNYGLFNSIYTEEQWNELKEYALELPDTLEEVADNATYVSSVRRAKDTKNRTTNTFNQVATALDDNRADTPVYEEHDLTEVLESLQLSNENATFVKAAIATLNEYAEEGVFNEHTRLNQFVEAELTAGRDTCKDIDIVDEKVAPSDTFIRMLAIIRHAVLLQSAASSRGKTPKWIRLEQMISVLLALKTDVLTQVETSEGKTLILQVVALAAALMGEKTDIITHAEKYAKEDCNRLVTTLGRKFGLSVRSRYLQLPGESAEQQQRACLDADIFYSDVYESVLDYQHRRYHNKPLRQANRILVDEDDNILVHIDASTTLQLAKAKPDVIATELEAFLNRLNTVIASSEVRQYKTLETLIDYIKTELQAINTYSQSLTDAAWQEWTQAAITSLSLSKDEDYTVAAIDKESGFYEVHIMHKRTSGREDKRSHWGHGVHQLVAARERALNSKVLIPHLSTVYADSDVANYLRYAYERRSGFSGTHGSPAMRTYMAEVLQAKCIYDMPRAKRDEVLAQASAAGEQRFYDVYFLEKIDFKALPHIEGDAIVITRDGHALFVHDGEYVKRQATLTKPAFYVTVPLTGVNRNQDDDALLELCYELGVKQFKASPLSMATLFAKHEELRAIFTDQSEVAFKRLQDKMGKIAVDMLAGLPQTEFNQIRWSEKSAPLLSHLVSRAVEKAIEKLQTPIAWPQVVKPGTKGETKARYDRRFDHAPVFESDQKAQYIKLLTAIRNAKAKGYSIMLFFTTIDECNHFHTFLKDNNVEEVQIFDDTGQDQENSLRPPEDHVVAQAKENGRVTLTTAAGGRATDFKGIDIAIATKPALQEVLIQAIARVGRNGALASTYQIYNITDLGDEVTQANRADKVYQRQVELEKALLEKEVDEGSKKTEEPFAPPVVNMQEIHLAPWQAAQSAKDMDRLKQKWGVNACKELYTQAFIKQRTKKCGDNEEALKEYNQRWEQFFSHIQVDYKMDQPPSKQPVLQTAWQQAFADFPEPDWQQLADSPTAAPDASSYRI